MAKKEILPIQNLIHEIRGQKVMLDSDLAGLYEIETKALNRAVKRNAERFPGFFMFQLSEKGGRRYLPYAFTEHGVLMLSSVMSFRKMKQTNKLRSYANFSCFILRIVKASFQNIARLSGKLLAF